MVKIREQAKTLATVSKKHHTPTFGVFYEVAHTRDIMASVERQHLKPTEFVPMFGNNGDRARTPYTPCFPNIWQSQCVKAIIYHSLYILGVVLVSVRYQTANDFSEIVTQSLFHFLEAYSSFKYKSLLAVVKNVTVAATA